MLAFEDLAEVAEVAEALVTTDSVVGDIVHYGALLLPQFELALWGQLFVISGRLLGKIRLRLEECRVVKLRVLMSELGPGQALDVELNQFIEV